MRSFLLALILIASVAWSGAAPAASHVYKIFVDGLACPFCAYGVEKNVLNLDGVDTLDININGGFITVVMQAGKVLDETKAAKAVADAGFTLRTFEALKGQQ
jgi:mercuric ion binding protein